MKHTFLSVALSALAMTANADVIINEVMQSNIDCVMDDINEFPDSWVELYNNGSEAVNLSKYKLGLTVEAASAWSLPEKSIPAKGYILIYCDKEASGLHTDFRLDSGKGGSVFLFNNDALTDSLTNIPKQPAPNIAYGRKKDGSSDIGFMLSPTPGASNCGTVTKKILGEPVFSHEGFVKQNVEKFNLTLSLPDDAPEGTEIRYTTDGSMPVSTSSKYVSPISISKTTCVRARLFCNGYLSPIATTNSYIFHTRNITLPVVSIVTDGKYFYDNKIGIYVDGTYSTSQKNYQYDWRRPINIEMYEKDGSTCMINQLCETRISGNATRGNKFKSLAIYANKRFGTKQFVHEFFPEQKPGITKFKSMVLRDAGNDFDYLFMRDAIIQRSVAKTMDVDWQAWQPFIVYINGEYKGMLNLRERSNEDNVFSNYDGLDDIDMIENWNEYAVKAGTKDSFVAFRKFYSESGHTAAEYEKLLDCDEFMNVMIANLYFSNVDFPGNNIIMWRPTEEGGRWRVIMKDTDFGIGLYGSAASYNTIQWLYNPNYDSAHNWGANSTEATLLFRQMMEVPEFKDMFLNRCAIYPYSNLGVSAVREVWDPMYNEIKTEYPYHRQLINPWWPNYSSEMSSAQSWLRNRPSLFVSMIANYYKVGTPANINVNNELTESELNGFDVTMNGVALINGKLTGKFYAGRTVTLSAKPTKEAMESNDYKVVKEWKVTITENGKQVTRTIEGDTCTFNMTSATVSVNAVTESATGIMNISTSADCVAPVAYYDLDGRQVSSLQSGHVYIVKYGDGSSRKVMK